MNDLRKITLREAIDEAEANNEILLGIDDYIQLGHSWGHILHCVIDFNTEGHPAYMVEIIRPRHLYGSEGQLMQDGLRLVGRSDESDFDRDERELSKEDWEKIPDNDFRMYAFKDTRPFYEGKPNPWHRMERGIHPAIKAYQDKWKPVPYLCG